MNIYIANLSYGTNDANLRELFEECGEVSSAKIITDKVTGRSRGFGFVEMPNDAEALKAIKQLNETEHDGKTIVVNAAKPRTENRNFFDNPRRGGGGGYNRGGDGYNSRRY